jgi:hypothetical protein
MLFVHRLIVIVLCPVLLIEFLEALTPVEMLPRLTLVPVVVIPVDEILIILGGPQLFLDPLLLLIEMVLNRALPLLPVRVGFLVLEFSTR